MSSFVNLNYETRIFKSSQKLSITRIVFYDGVVGYVLYSRIFAGKYRRATKILNHV
ncbi:hypothetical protein LEP1GSC049_1421 [Leptospira kirschneri serovar Cynopteri str. 3522 CT]|nr:hypothetical protein LEP1GSC049_1421 [Leptospira kirschneri serovar Cynopteri str. 3522 CT]